MSKFDGLMEACTIHDPLILHLLFAKRQPNVIAGFLDSSEFSTSKDIAPHRTLHDSIEKVEMRMKDGVLIIWQLLDLDQENLVEGPPVLENHAFIE
jgi:hypothetical protein